MSSEIHSKINHEKVWESMPKGSQYGPKIDAETRKKAMQKVIAKKGVTIMDKCVFLQG